MLANWIPDPLHPAVVHLPIALAILLPLVALATWVATLRGARPLAAWGATVAAAALLVVSSWVALETGEDQEDAVERVVTEQALHRHEESAEEFLGATVGLLGLTLLGLLPRKAGTVARAVAVVGSAGVLVMGWRVGHSGGELVYRYGAAQAYVSTDPPQPGAARLPEADH